LRDWLLSFSSGKVYIKWKPQEWQMAKREETSRKKQTPGWMNNQNPNMEA
jgi:hypothetical protein